MPIARPTTHAVVALVLFSATAVAVAGSTGRTSSADGDLVADFDYTMPSRFRVPELPGPLALGLEPTRYFDGPVTPDSWRIDLDACASGGPIERFEWTLDGEPLATANTCADAFFEVPKEGIHLVTLTVHDASGGQASRTRLVRVEDWLVIAMGDSYASGEGSADVPFDFPAVQAAHSAFAAAEAAAQAALVEWTVDRDDTEALLALTSTALERYDAWQTAVATRNQACDPLKFPPTPLLCVEAQAAATASATQLVAALTSLGLETLFGETTLLGVISNLRTSAQNALAAATALLEAADAALEAARNDLEATLVASLPRWQGRGCHRSARSGQVLAAESLEAADPRTSVTFVHLACSGATVNRGMVLNDYDGPESGGAPLPPQVEQAAVLAGDRPLDVAVVSIGGNDVNFAELITACVTSEPCFDPGAADDPAVSSAVSDFCTDAGPLAVLCEQAFGAYLERPPGDAASLFFEGGDNDGLDDLPANYALLQQQLERQLSSRPRVFLTAYPQLTRGEPDAPGGPSEPCAWDEFAPKEVRLKNLPGLTLPEILWAEQEVQPALAQAMEAAARKHGWTFVDAHAERFDGHGYCADANWIVRLDQSLVSQPVLDDPVVSLNGAVHPGPVGHHAYAAAITDAVLCDLYPDCDPGAGEAIGLGVSGRKLSLKDVEGKPWKRKLQLVSHSRDLPEPTAGGDPSVFGAVMRVTTPAGDDELFLLPAVGWRGQGDPAVSQGYKYVDKDRAHGPCSKVVWRPGEKLLARCKGAGIGISLDEPVQQAVGVSFRAGSDPPICMAFGGNVKKDRPATRREPGRFTAKYAPAPEGCGLP